MDYENFAISEAGLSRVLTRESESTDMALLTAFRQSYTLSQNTARNKQLEMALN